MAIHWTGHSEFHVKQDPMTSNKPWWVQNRAGAILAYCDTEDEARDACAALIKAREFGRPE